MDHAIEAGRAFQQGLIQLLRMVRGRDDQEAVVLGEAFDHGAHLLEIEIKANLTSVHPGDRTDLRDVAAEGLLERQRDG